MKKYNLFFRIIIIITFVDAVFITIAFLNNYPPMYKFISIGILGIGIGAYLCFKMFYRRIKKMTYQEKKLGLWNSISYKVKKAGETSFNEMPLGIIVFNNSSTIEWANNYSQKIFQSKLVEKSLENLDKEFAAKVTGREETFKIEIYGKVYECVHMRKDHIIYLTNVTDITDLNKRYQNRMLAIGILNLDNANFVMNGIDAQERASHMSRIVGILSDWGDEYNVLIRALGEARYIMIMDRSTLDKVAKLKFNILSSIKNYCEQNKLKITASIGISCNDKKAPELLSDALYHLEMALDRGGNQAITNVNSEITYFGGKSEAFENRTPEYIRMQAEEIERFIKKYKTIYIMGHKNADADAFGACIAASKMVLACGAKPKIVIDDELIDATVKEMMDDMKTTVAPTLSYLANPNEANKNITDNDGLMIVDCQYQSLLMNEKLYRKAKNIAIFDHHRRNPSAINNYEFILAHPSSSSTVELLIEILPHLDETKYKITENEATWMLTGIIVDTNNFMFHTSDRTFQVVAFLQKHGAKIPQVQGYLREDIKEFSKKVQFLNKIERVDDVFGIIVCDDQIYERAFMAKVADSAMAISNLNATFCIGYYEKDKVNISARSLEGVNVQLIMEKLDGGGHFTTAATQIADVTINQAKEMLIECLKNNIKEGENTMKVILKKDVKGRGKEGDIIELQPGYANYLIRNKDAVEANVENVKTLEKSKVAEAEKREQIIKDNEVLKKKIDSSVITIKVKTGKEGKMFGSVSTKAVVEKFKEEKGIELNKKKIIYEGSINALGTYKLPITLYGDITATITLHVVEGIDK